MNRFLFASAILWFSSHSCLAQIGETEEELARRYGPPSAYDARISTLVWWKEYHKVLDEVHPFHANNLDIVVYFRHGKAVLFRYGKKDRSPMTNDELALILNMAVKKQHWLLIPGNNRSDLRWRTRDSSVFAYYYRGRKVGSIYEGPRYNLLVQTAPVDAVYKQMNRDWYKSYSRRR